MNTDAVTDDATAGGDAYVAPTLVRLGTLSEITLGGFSGFGDAAFGEVESSIVLPP
jgi:hypothetical protein